MVSRLPLYKEVAATEKVDALLERGDTHVSLQLCFDSTDAHTAPGLPPGYVDAVNAAAACLPSPETRETITAVAAVQAALPDVETMATISRTVAAVERFGVPALVSSSPLSQAEAAQFLRDPPRISPADEAAFAAAARDLSLKGSPCPASRSN